MRTRTTRGRQAGFSMVELLMAAFILAVGILGLSMLQVMSLRASRGSRSLSTAVEVGERLLDQVEMEGRLTWLNVTATQYTGSGITPVPNLQYVNQVGTVTVPGGFTIKGRTPDPASTDPLDHPATPYFTATVQRSANAVATGVDGLQVHDFTVQVTFIDTVQAGSTTATVPRTVTLTRRIVHA